MPINENIGQQVSIGKGNIHQNWGKQILMLKKF